MGFWTWYWEQQDADDMDQASAERATKRASAPAVPRKFTPEQLASVPQSCSGCGDSLEGQTRSYTKCDDCFLEG